MKIDISHITLPDDFHEISDLYIPEEYPMSGILYPNASELRRRPEYHDIVNFLLTEAKRKNKLEFSLEMVHEQDRIIFRGHSIKSIEGKVFIFRRLPSYIPDIEDLGMPANIVELLLHKRLNSGGLVLIAGETGQGKSTTAASSIAYRLKNHASFCLTIEDPIEMPLQGFYENENGEKGVCFQTSAEGEEIFDAIKSALRCYPSKSNSILFLGETRDAMMASEVLKIAANGHLVITTMHGGDLMTSLKRFLGLAMSYKNANEAEVLSLFSSVFRLMIHQRIETLGTGTKKLRPQILFSPSSSSSIATRLRTGKLEMLATEIQAQNMMIQKNQSIADLGEK
jgi:twitching motility protein PilT